jgi:excinuclease ABC subunit B
MKRAIDETERRRAKQQQYNLEHGITPKGVKKAIYGSIDDKESERKEEKQFIAKVAEEQAKYAALTPKQLAKRLQQMEQQMYRHAQNLEFEQAAELRNEIQHIRSVALGPETA